MKTKQTIVYGLLAVILALTFVSCPEDDNNGGNGTGGGGGGGDNWKWTAVSDSTIWQYTHKGDTGTASSRAIAYGNNRFIAGGGYDYVDKNTSTTSRPVTPYSIIASSTDGESWSGISIGGSSYYIYYNSSTLWQDSQSGSCIISAIAYGIADGESVGRFVAGRGRYIIYSTDATSWTRVNSTFGTDRIYGIAYGNNRFVAVGYNGKMAYSTDGISWTAVSNSTFGTSGIYDIAYGGGRFVAVGGSGKMAYSDDGASWTAVSNSTFGTSTYDIIRGIAYGNGRFIAVGSGGKMAYSSDNGETWTAVANSPFPTYYGGGYAGGGGLVNSINAVTYGNNRWVAGGMGGKMAYSDDNGVTWTAVSDSTLGTTSNDYIYGIAYGNNRFVAVGDNGKMAYADWTGE